MALALGAGILQARPGQNWMAPGAKALMQARQAHQQQQVDQPRVDAYRAQTLLHAMNQFGGKAMSPAERARAIEIQTWHSPDGTQVRTFPYDTATQQYLEGLPPQDWNYTDRAIPIVPGMTGSNTGRPTGVGNVDPEKYTPESLQRFSQTGDFSALEWREPPSKGGKEAAKYKTWSYMVQQLDPLLEELKKNPTARNTLGTMGAWGAKLTAGLGMFDKLVGTDYKEAVKQFYGGLDPREVKSEVDRVVLPVAKIMVDPSGPLANQEQLRAQLQTGIDTLEKGSTWSDPDQAYKTLTDTMRIMAGATDIMSGGDGTSTPSGLNATPPQQPSPEGGVLRYNPATGRVE
jgi:hypothetical protein